MDETRIPGRPSFPPTRIGAPRKVSKKKFQIQDKLHQEREDRVVEALSTAGPAPVPPRYFCDFKQIRIRTATFWRWRSLAQELGLEGDEQMASYLLNMYYEYVRKAASEEEKRDIPQNSKEARQRIETSLLQDDQKGIETDDIESTILPTQGTQDGSIGLHQGKYPSDSMKERSKDGWRGDGDGTDDGGKKVLEGEFTCLVKAEPDQSDEEFNQHGTLASCSQQEDDWTGGDDDNGQKIVGREFTCLIKEEPDDSDRESNQPSCSQQGGNSGKQSSCQQKGNIQITLSGDASHDRSHGRHLPVDFPLQAVLGSHSHSSPRDTCSSEYGSYLLSSHVDYSQGQRSADDSATMSDHNDERLEGEIAVVHEKYGTDSIQHMKKLSPVCATRSIQSNPCINPCDENTFLCPVCNKEFNRKDNLRRHMKFHEGKRPYECSFCNKTFVQKGDLKRHERSHTGERPYSCSFCDKRFLDTSHLKAHLVIHTGEKPHECSFCDKAFSQSAHLTVHMRRHRGEKPFECSLCDSSFSSKSQLVNHHIKHTGVKPYQCSICEKRVGTKNSLNQHMKIHSGEKPFQCSVCSKSFRQKSTLKNHMKTHGISLVDL